MDGNYGIPIPMNPAAEATQDFDTLFSVYYERLARLLYRITGDMGQAEEAAAEAFWRLHRNPPATKTNLEGWLYRTGFRLSLDQLKKERRRARHEALSAAFGFAESPEKPLIQDEQRERVRQTLAALKPEQAMLLLLRSEEFSHAQLASALHLNPASVGTLLARAEQAFRKEYMKRYGEPESL
jgi:RNA polymerase sigma-70 factor, ECF subfamily